MRPGMALTWAAIRGDGSNFTRASARRSSGSTATRESFSTTAAPGRAKSCRPGHGLVRPRLATEIYGARWVETNGSKGAQGADKTTNIRNRGEPMALRTTGMSSAAGTADNPWRWRVAEYRDDAVEPEPTSAAR